MIARSRLVCRILAVMLLTAAIEAHYDGMRYLPLPALGLAVFLLIVGYGHDLLADEQARQLASAQRRIGDLAQLLADARRELIEARPERPPRRREPEVDDGRFAPSPPPAWTQAELPPRSPELERLTQPWRTVASPGSRSTPLRRLDWEQPPVLALPAPERPLVLDRWPFDPPDETDQPEAGIPTHEGPPDDEAQPAMGEGPRPAGPEPSSADADYASRLGVFMDRPTMQLGWTVTQ